MISLLSWQGRVYYKQAQRLVEGWHCVFVNIKVASSNEGVNMPQDIQAIYILREITTKLFHITNPENNETNKQAMKTNK